MTKARLYLAGEQWYGWKSLTVRRSIEQACSTLEVALTLVNPTDLRALEVRVGSEARVEIEIANGQWAPLWSGYLERLDAHMTAERLSVSCAGRSRVVVLLKRETEISYSGHQGLTLEQLVRMCCEPCGVEYVYVGESLPLPEVRLLRGTSVWEAIERYARAAGMYVTDDALGRLVVASPGHEGKGSPIVWGKSQVLEWHLLRDVSNRYTIYRVLSQKRNGDVVVGEARDNWTKADYIWSCVAESALEAKHANRRAMWEMLARRAKSLTIEAVVPQILEGVGVLWRPGCVHRVVWERFDLDEDMLLLSVEYRLSEREERAGLYFVPMEGYQWE